MKFSLTKKVKPLFKLMTSAILLRKCRLFSFPQALIKGGNYAVKPVIDVVMRPHIKRDNAKIKAARTARYAYNGNYSKSVRA
jgi:hypothetical protein